MNSLLLVFSVVMSLNNITMFETSNPNVGFGISSDCAGSQYLEFCVNGPLVGDDGLPVGGYVDNGVQKKTWTKPAEGGGNFAISNGIFGLDTKGVIQMSSYEDRESLPEMKWAFQNGPILVQEGKNTRGTSVSRHKRSGIGVTEDNKLIVLVSEDPLTFREFAELFVQASCVSAIYLDGGPYVGWSNNEIKSGMVEGAIKLQFYNN
jgi:uncharacterized protein YigE (DUF2233 family)